MNASSIARDVGSATRTRTPREAGTRAIRGGALQTLAGRPFGAALVWAVGIGLVCMALWRLSEAVFGAGPPAPAHTPPRIRPRASHGCAP